MDDLVLALDLVRRLGQKLARRLLPQDITFLVGGSQLVGRVRLAETKLQSNQC